MVCNRIDEESIDILRRWLMAIMILHSDVTQRRCPIREMDEQGHYADGFSDIPSVDSARIEDGFSDDQ